MNLYKLFMSILYVLIMIFINGCESTEPGTMTDIDDYHGIEIANYYVAKDGDDYNPGTIDQPFRTIKKAYGLAGPGDIILVREGTYTEHNGGQFGVLAMNRNGTTDRPITLKAYAGEVVVLDGQNINDMEHRSVIKITGNYNIVDGIEVTRGFQGGISLYGSYNQIINCHIHHNGNIGISGSHYGQSGIYSDKAQHDNLYANNYIHHNGRLSENNQLDHGLYLCGDNESVIRNVITYNASFGIQIAGYNTISNSKIYHNVLAFNGEAGIVLWLDLDGIDIKNNIFYKNETYGLIALGAKGKGIVIDYNLFYGDSRGEINLSDLPVGSYTLGNKILYKKNPLFINENNYDLQSGSPAINAGMHVGLPYLGKAPDLGFVEKQ